MAFVSIWTVYTQSHSPLKNRSDRKEIQYFIFVNIPEYGL